MGKRFSFFVLLMAFMLTAAGLPQHVEAAAGIISLPRTGQTTSYATGDDGDLQNGVAWPATRFVENVTGAMTDTLTGLIWAKDAGTPTAGACAGGRKSWQGALDYVACLNSNVYLGFSDWRLPNIVEMESLFNDGAANSATWLSTQGFSNVQSSYSYYWSSTTYPDTTGSAWGVHLSDTQNFYGYSKTTNTYFSWPVRGATADPSRLRRSGQSMSYATGDDGQLETGVAWPEPRFTADATGQCLTDGLTGLTWVRYPLPTLRTWQEALDYANGLNLCGYIDWRLPNRQELRSLVNYGETLTASYMNAAAFGGVRSRNYWSSTTNAATGSAWDIDLGSGSDNTLSKTGRYSTLAVRSGTAPAPTGHALSGRVTSGGVALAGVTISLSGPLNQVTQTDGNGNYAFAELPDGSYTLTPARNYYSFTPTQLAAAISGADLSGRVFTASLSPYGWIDMSDNLSGLTGKATLGGMSWISADEGWITSGAVGEIYHTTDGGVTFTTQTTQYYTNAIHMLNANEGYAGGLNGRVYHTTNGGGTWSVHGSIGSSLRSISFPPSSTTGYCSGDTGKIYSITSTGVISMSTGVVSNLKSITFPGSQGWVCGEDVIEHYNSTWLFDQSYPQENYNGIFMINNTTGWAVGDSGVIIHTTDGINWDYQTNPDTTPTKRTLLDVFFMNSNEGWAVGFGGVVLHTKNGGTTWVLEADAMTSNILTSVRFTSATNGYVLGNNGTLLKYTSLPQPPTVTTSAVSNVAATTAVSGGNVTSDGEGAVSARGVCWSTTAGPTTAGSCSGDGTGPGHFASAITGLLPLTTYFIRAYATNTAGTAYGDGLYFTTPCPSEVARIGTTGYGTLQEAIDGAGTTAEIRGRAMMLPEDLLISGNRTMALLGGYDCVFTTVIGVTTVHGTITIGGSAAITLGNVLIQ